MVKRKEYKYYCGKTRLYSIKMSSNWLKKRGCIAVIGFLVSKETVALCRWESEKKISFYETSWERLNYHCERFEVDFSSVILSLIFLVPHLPLHQPSTSQASNHNPRWQHQKPDLASVPLQNNTWTVSFCWKHKWSMEGKTFFTPVIATYT